MRVEKLFTLFSYMIGLLKLTVEAEMFQMNIPREKVFINSTNVLKKVGARSLLHCFHTCTIDYDCGAAFYSKPNGKCYHTNFSSLANLSISHVPKDGHEIPIAQLKKPNEYLITVDYCSYVEQLEHVKAEREFSVVGKPAYQDSDYLLAGTIPLTAEKAVDGNTNANSLAMFCSHTDTGKNPWWIVDLQERVLIEKVIITNRADCCSYRLRDFTIDVGDIFDSKNKKFHEADFTTVAEFPDPQPAGEVVLPISRFRMRPGRYMKIQKHNKEMNDDALALCEVKIKGTPCSVP